MIFAITSHHCHQRAAATTTIVLGNNFCFSWHSCIRFICLTLAPFLCSDAGIFALKIVAIEVSKKTHDEHTKNEEMR